MFGMNRPVAGIAACATAFACGGLTTTHTSEVDGEESSIGGTASGTHGDGSHGPGGGGVTGGFNSGPSATSGAGDGSGAMSGVSASGGGGLLATGGSDMNGGGSGTGHMPGIGGVSSTPVAGCQSFTRVLDAESCAECRAMAEPTCEVYFRQTEMACIGSYQCFLRHCAFSCWDRCEEDTCACLESCLPIGPGDCRSAFETLMGCYATFCGDC